MPTLMGILAMSWRAKFQSEERLEQSSGSVAGFDVWEMLVQGGPLPVISGVITPVTQL